jgi:hypothetical protein
MTEAEWDACAEPTPMLRFLRGRGSDRKLRLFACACCRRIPDGLDQKACQIAVETAERFADGLASPAELATARKTVSGVRAAAQAAREDAGEAAEFVAFTSSFRSAGCRLLQAMILRDLFAPFHSPRIDDAWLAWNDAAIPKMARAVYDERSFDRLPLLADTLENAGCADADIVTHLRGPSPHVRGCWALNLLLAKG